MGVAGGPDMIENGLVLSLDAADRNSYVSGSTNWFDLSGVNRSGSLINGPTFNTGSGGSVIFDGVDDLMEGNDGGLFNFGTGDFSIDVWMKYNTLQIGYKSIFSRGNPSVGTKRWFYLAKYHADNKFLFAVDDDILKKEVISNTVAQVNTWYHLTGVRRAGNASELYINGIFESSQSDAGNSLDANLSDCLFRFAAHRGAAQVAYEFCDCTISNGKIYNRALSASEVLQNYNATKTRFGL